MSLHENLPYLECSRLIANISLALAKSGETQFVSFVDLHEILATQFDKEVFLRGMTEFDFILGSPTGRQILSILILNKLYLEVKNIFLLTKQDLQRKLRLLINTVDADPPSSKKLIRLLSLADFDITPANKVLFLGLNQKLKNLEEALQVKEGSSKALFYAPLKYLEENYIRKIMYDLCFNFDSVLLFINQKFFSKEYLHILDELFFLKENIISEKIDLTYDNFLRLIQEVFIFIEKNDQPTSFKLGHNYDYENMIYGRRFVVQLAKLGEDVIEVKKLEEKLKVYCSEYKIRLSEIKNEEFQHLANNISAENIAKARLELRLNDEEYPLSVAYREVVKGML